jgi:predicted RNase H-like HicB family nuclease
MEPAAEESLKFVIEIEQEEDGRWLAEVPDLPGVMTYGQSRAEAIARVQALALRVLAERTPLRATLRNIQAASAAR